MPGASHAVRGSCRVQQDVIRWVGDASVPGVSGDLPVGVIGGHNTHFRAPHGPGATALEQCLFSHKLIIHPQRLISRRVPPDNRLIRRILPPLQTSATLDPEP